MSYPTPQIEIVRDNIIRIHHPELLDPKTYLTAAVSATGTTLTVKDNSGFSNTDPQTMFLLEKFGTKTAEIKRVNGSVTAGTSITTTAVTFSHSINTPVSKILFDQVEISGASTLTGSKTVIDTVNITVSCDYTDFVVTGTTYSYYFARFKNSLATTPYYGGYSDGIAYTDFEVGTIGFIRRNAFKNINEVFGDKFDNAWVLDQIYLCDLDISKELKRWSFFNSFDYDLGNVSEGVNYVALPSDIEDPNTNKSILGIRIGTGDNLTYIDKSEYEYLYQDIANTTLASTASVGATSLVLTDSRDFNDSGSVNISGTYYTYTTNTRATNTLSGLTALTAEITSGSQVWQNVDFSEPRRYTVNEGYIYFDVPPSDDFEGRNIWLDYYRKPSRKDSDTDVPDVTDYRLHIYWLEMAIKRMKSNGDLSPTDISFLQYMDSKKKLIQNEISGQHLRLVPDVYLPYGNRGSWWNR